MADVKGQTRGKRNATDRFHNKKNTANRSKRNQARRVMKKALTKKHGAKKAAAMMKGKEVGHKKPLSKGGTNALSNLTLQSVKKNRGSDRPTGPRKRSNGRLRARKRKS